MESKCLVFISEPFKNNLDRLQFNSNSTTMSMQYEDFRIYQSINCAKSKTEHKCEGLNTFTNRVSLVCK